MIDLLYDFIATQTGLRVLENPVLFQDLLDDAPPQTGFVYVVTRANKLRFVLRVFPASLQEIEDYWWER